MSGRLPHNHLGFFLGQCPRFSSIGTEQLIGQCPQFSTIGTALNCSQGQSSVYVLFEKHCAHVDIRQHGSPSTTRDFSHRNASF